MPDTRERMIDAAVNELQMRGVSGMAFTDVLAKSGAARGAIYHHFPGGKAQLVAEAAQTNGQQVADYLSTLTATTPTGVVGAFIAAVRPVVAASARGGGCAVAAVTVGCDLDKQLQEVASIAFGSWTGELALRLQSAGMKKRAATDLANLLITLLEGAHVLCRAAGNTEPFERCARALALLSLDSG
jgi:TetR/AcrR family transcriptional repressor of lmrAB and yxaGH operons